MEYVPKLAIYNRGFGIPLRMFLEETPLWEDNDSVAVYGRSGLELIPFDPDRQYTHLILYPNFG
jgi:hypothetical protein